MRTAWRVGGAHAGEDNPLRGLVRTVVKDSTDGPARLYLDSDGAVADNSRLAPLPGAANITDGRWHMVTLTTRPPSGPGGAGYELWVDGRLAGQVPPPLDPPLSWADYVYGAAGQREELDEVDGGDPMLPMGACVYHASFCAGCWQAQC